MKGALTKKHIAEQARRINLPLVVKVKARQNETSIHHLSLIMGNDGNFLSRTLRRKDHHISLLIALSLHLQTNLLEQYFQLLPENLRATKTEKQLQLQMDEMEKQLMEVIKERDWLKQVVAAK